MGVEVDDLEDDLEWSKVLHCIRSPFQMRCGFDRWSTHMSIRVHRKAFLAIKLLAYPRGLSLSRMKTQFSDRNWGLFVRLHFTIGWNNRRRFSWCRHGFQFSGIQILFADHMHRRSGVYNKFSFHKFMVDGGGRRQFSEGEKNAVLCFSFNFLDIFGQPPRASRAHRSGHSVSSWDRSSNFGTLGSRWWGSPGQIIPSEGFSSRMSAWRTTSLVNWTHRIDFSMFEFFRKIQEDFGGSTSWNTQPSWSCVLQDSHCTFVTILFRLLARL